MMKVRLKDIRNYPATDITNYSSEAAYELFAKTDRRIVATSIGTYGVSGLLFEDLNTGDMYKICNRTEPLWIFL